jgi:ACT domain-containing protein
MIMMVDLAGASVPFEEVKRRLAEKGTSMGLRIDAQHEDVFKYMHRI